MVVVSHDREFLDQLCNKLVETEQGVATTYKGNYTEYVKTKEEKIGQQWAAWEKQQKEIARQVGNVFAAQQWFVRACLHARVCVMYVPELL